VGDKYKHSKNRRKQLKNNFILPLISKAFFEAISSSVEGLSAVNVVPAIKL
jgi:hypothetical protein